MRYEIAFCGIHFPLLWPTELELGWRVFTSRFHSCYFGRPSFQVPRVWCAGKWLWTCLAYFRNRFQCIFGWGSGWGSGLRSLSLWLMLLHVQMTATRAECIWVPHTPCTVHPALVPLFSSPDKTLSNEHNVTSTHTVEGLVDVSDGWMVILPSRLLNGLWSELGQRFDPFLSTWWRIILSSFTRTHLYNRVRIKTPTS